MFQPTNILAFSRRKILACGLIVLAANFGQIAKAQEKTEPAKSRAKQPAAKPLPYQMPSPEGWGKERIQLPPGFAREMSWKGHEDIRFAPGMFKSKEEDFFTYIVLFWIEGKPQLTEEKLTVELKKYYQGLCNAVLRGRAPDKIPQIVVVKFRPKPGANPGEPAATAPSPKAAPKAGAPKLPATSDKEWRQAQLRWTEPFTTAKTQVLNLELKSGEVGDHTYVLLLVSPSKKDSIWKPLRKLASEIKFRR